MNLTGVKFCCVVIGCFFYASLYADIPLSRDPTAPAFSITASPSKQAADKPNYVVKSILVDGSRRIALINDKFVSKGDMVNNAEIIAIHKNSVDLMESGQKITVYLFDAMQE